MASFSQRWGRGTAPGSAVIVLWPYLIAVTVAILLGIVVSTLLDKLCTIIQS
jgi:hypothetical protein